MSWWRTWVERGSAWASALDARQDAWVGRLPPRVRAGSRYVEPVLLAFGFLLVVLPMLVTRDLPLVDVPNHLAAVHAWQHIDDPSWGYGEHFSAHVSVVPYWGYYGFLRVAAEVMPLRLANKLFLLLTFAGTYAGLLLLLRAHRRPRILALGSLVGFWNYTVWWGFLSSVGGLSLLFVSFYYLRQLGLRERVRARDLAINAAFGVALLFFHPMALLMWLLGVLAYSWSWRAVVALPSLAAFVSMGEGITSSKNHIIKIEGMWREPAEAASRLYEEYVFAYFPTSWNDWLFAAIGASLVGSWLLAKRPADEPRDPRPWRLLAILTVAFFALPLHLQQPLGVAVVAPRVAPVIFLALCLLGGQGELRGWRKAVVTLPLLVALLVVSSLLTSGFRKFERENRDFYATLETAPAGAKIMTLVYERHIEGLRGNLLTKYPSYVMLEKGGYSPLLWRTSQGIGRRKFPLAYREGAKEPPHVSDGHERKFSWPKHGPAYDYFLTRAEPKGVFTDRPELELVARRGRWRLWKKTRPLLLPAAR